MLKVGIPCRLCLVQSLNEAVREQPPLFVRELIVSRQVKGCAHLGQMTPHHVAYGSQPLFATVARTSWLHTLILIVRKRLA